MSSDRMSITIGPDTLLTASLAPVIFHNLTGRNFVKLGEPAFREYVNAMTYEFECPLMGQRITLRDGDDPILEGEVGECF